MIVLGKDKVEKFIKKHALAKKAILVWISVLENGHFRHLADLHRVFPSADYAKPFTIFNIGGNKFRVIVIMVYSGNVATIEAIFTHKEYDAWNRK